MEMVEVFRGDEERLTLGKLCTRVEVNISTGHRWRLSGKLDCYKIGGRHFVSRESWERFIERCNDGGSTSTRPSVPGARTQSQRRRDDERAARQCELMGV